jgi:uncharacterized C2H2 Zn-finger protein
MPRCPRCEKRFKTDGRVLRHMNQPRVSCVNFVDDLVRSLHRNTRQYSGAKQSRTEGPDIQMETSEEGNEDSRRAFSVVELLPLR